MTQSNRAQLSLCILGVLFLSVTISCSSTEQGSSSGESSAGSDQTEVATAPVTPPAKVEPPPKKTAFELGGDATRGRKGNGGGLMGKSLKPKPADFTSKRMLKRTDQRLYREVRDGGKPFKMSDKMTPWKGVLSDREIRDVVAYIRTFARK